jgi:hypothetical protein
MTRYAKRKLKYSRNENFNLLPYVEWDRFVTLTGAQAEWGSRDFLCGEYNVLSKNVTRDVSQSEKTSEVI